MKTLPEKIFAIYPELTSDPFIFVEAIRLEDKSDGKGAYIAQWNHPTLPKPTKAQLKAEV